MKIAFVAAANCPHTIKWVNALQKAGHTITLYSMPDHVDAEQEISGEVAVEYLKVPAAEKGDTRNTIQLRGSLAGFDAVVAIEIPTYGRLATRTGTRNLLLVTTGVDLFGVEGFFARLRLKGIVRLSKGVLATAPNIVTHLDEMYKNKLEHKTYVVPFGVDTKLFAPKEDAKEEHPVFGSIKFLESYNEVDQTIDAFGKFMSEYDGKATLRIIGNGPEEAALKQKAETAGVADHVEFMGYVKNADLPAEINKMDAVVQMTMEEGFGVSAIEAMACEVPVIASDTNGAAEYILDHVTGYLVKAGNTDACADRMKTIAEDRAGGARLGGMARGDIEQRYELSDCVKKFEEALEEVAK